MMTSQPRSARASTMARPMLRLLPVTRATCPRSDEPSSEVLSPPSSELDAGADLEHPLRRNAEEIGGGAGVERHEPVHALAPAHHGRGPGGQDPRAAEVEG